LIETKRLILRQMTEDDTESFLEIFTDPKAMKYFGIIFDQSQIDNWVKSNLEHQEKHGFSLFSVVLKSNDEVIGDCGLESEEIDGEFRVGIGFDFKSKYWNNGYATEAATAVLDYGFKEYDFDRISGWINPENAASRRVAEKVGLLIEKSIVRGGKEQVLYTINQDDWKKINNADAMEIPLKGGGRTDVSRIGNVVHRKTGPWASTVHSLLKHLEDVGFPGAPRVVNSGFDNQGREILTYIEGEFVHPGPWPERAMPILGGLLRELHWTAKSFPIPENAIWRQWYGRSLGGSNKVIGHCDMGPWNIVSRDKLPVAMIDWEVSGPIDPIYELAQTCWLNAQLYDDDVAELVGLSSLKERAHHVRLILDGYELPHSKRSGFVHKMIELAVRDAAEQVIEAKVTPETKDPTSLWGITWRTRSAAWMLKNCSTLVNIIEKEYV